MAPGSPLLPLRLVLAVQSVPRRDELRAALGAAGITVCGSAGVSADAIIDVYRQQPDAVLLELGLPGLPAEETVRHVQRATPGVHVYLLATRGQRGLSPALDAGARDVLDAALPPERIAAVLLRGPRRG